MKTEEQIKQMLQQSESEFTDIKKWEEKALDTYRENRKAFGQADYGEVSEASQQLAYRKGEIEALKWVLSQQ